MNVAIVGEGWWEAACKAAEACHNVMSPPVQPPATAYSAGPQERLAAGARWRDELDGRSFDVIVDNGGAGLAFVSDRVKPGSVKLLHETLKVPLASHLIDPLVTVFQSMPWAAAWPCLQSDTWYKFIWDKPQTEELRAFGVPQVHYLPMAAPDRDYNTSPLTEADARYAVSFVGGQNTTYFYPQRSVPTASLLPGTLAQAVRAGMRDICFFDIYYDLYKIAERPTPDGPVDGRMNEAMHYFNQKLFYNASRCIHQRDRFIIFLNRRLGDAFVLVGENWDTAYGLTCHPQFPTTDAYLDHFRQTAVNLNFVNGNSDSGLNMRHFEITAAGGFMLCYHQDEIDDFFEVGRECDTFRTEQELLEKIRLYLEYPRKRIEIARAGQQRALSEHLYSHRLREILRVVGDRGGARPGEPLIEEPLAVGEREP